MSTATTTSLLTHAEGGIVRLTLNRPEKRNALSRELLARHGEALAHLAADPSARVVVLADDSATMRLFPEGSPWLSKPAAVETAAASR